MTADAERSASWLVPCEPLGVRQARLAVGSFLDGSSGAGDRDAVLLVVSELVSNAVQHARTQRPIDLRVDIHGEHVHIEVGDADPDPPRARRAAVDDESGHGLAIVDQLSRRWGVRLVDGDGKRVWCDLGPPAP